jgi:hypothetical protein
VKSMGSLSHNSSRAVSIRSTISIRSLFCLAATVLASGWGLGCAGNSDWRSFEWPKGGLQTDALQEDIFADLPTPENLRAISGELRAVPLAWEPLLAGDVAGYRVERAAAPEGPFEILAEVQGRLSTLYVDRDTAVTIPPVSSAPSDLENPAATEADASAAPSPALKDGMRWFYRVRAFSPHGAMGQEASSVIEATTAAPPAPPQDLRAYSRQPRMVPLSWRVTHDPNIVGYRVERSPTSRGPFESIAKIDGRYQTTFVDRELGDLRVFYFRVASINAAGGVGKPSPAVRAVTKPEPLPPINLRITAKQLGINRLAWDPNVEEDIIEYRLLRARGDETPPQPVASLLAGQTTATDISVSAGEKVSYTIVALDRDGLMSDAAEAVVVRSEDYGLSASLQKDGVHLEWDPRSDEGFHGALVRRATLFGKRDFGLQTDGQFHDPDVNPGSTQRYIVTLERADGSLAPPSAPVEIQIPRPGVD